MDQQPPRTYAIVDLEPKTGVMKRPDRPIESGFNPQQVASKLRELTGLDPEKLDHYAVLTENSGGRYCTAEKWLEDNPR